MVGHLRDKYTIHVPALDLTKVDRTFADGLVPQYQVPNPNVHTPSGVPGLYRYTTRSPIRPPGDVLLQAAHLSHECPYRRDG